MNKSKRKAVRQNQSEQAIPPAALEPTHAQIRKRAYAIYEESGRLPGREQDNWLLAEKELKVELELQLLAEREFKQPTET